MPKFVSGILSLMRAQFWSCKFWSCTEIWFDENSGWKSPRTELSQERLKVWNDRHQEDISTLDAALGKGLKKPIVLIGDSITENWVRQTFGSHVNHSRESSIEGKGLLSQSVLTFAIGGDRIQEIGYRLFKLKGMQRLIALEPEVVVLSIGTNDYGHGENASIAVEEYKLLIRQIRQSLPKSSRLVLQAILPRRNPDGQKLEWTDANNAFVFQQQLSRTMREAANSNAAQYIDCSQTFLNGSKIDARLFREDLLHLSRQGYRKWGRCLSDALGTKVTVDETSATTKFLS